MLSEIWNQSYRPMIEIPKKNTEFIEQAKELKEERLKLHEVIEVGEEV